MRSKVKNWLGKFPLNRKLNAVRNELARTRDDIDELKILQGKNLALEIAEKKNVDSLSNVEFKVFSQWGEDGIIQYLVNNIEISQNKFVEFGVEDYSESNTRFLMVNNNWSGLVIDNLEENVERLKEKNWYWKYDLTAVCALLDQENVNNIFSKAGYSGEIGILSIDVDGNDYWIWKAINIVNPDIVVIEYNSLFGGERTITIPYSNDFSRSAAHYSHLYFGASLGALKHLAAEKGYSLVGCNSTGINAFFVRNNLITPGIKKLCDNAKFVQRKFRESRDSTGRIDLLPVKKQIELLKGLSVLNVETGNIEKI